MMQSKLKILCLMTISLMLLFSPFVLDNSPDGKAYAMGLLGKKAGGHRSSGNRVIHSNPGSGSGTKTEPALGPVVFNDEQTPPSPVPEPATLFLFGAGAVGMAAFRKKFRKKQ